MRFALIAVVTLALLGCSPERVPTGPTPLAEVVPPFDPPDLAGEYVVTFVAENCEPSFPAEFRTRTYAARLEQDGADVSILVIGPMLFTDSHTPPRLWGQILPDRVTLTNYYGNDQWEAVSDSVSPAASVGIFVDQGRLTASAGGLSGNFSGAFLLTDRREGRGSATLGKCLSVSHQVVFSR